MKEVIKECNKLAVGGARRTECSIVSFDAIQDFPAMLRYLQGVDVLVSPPCSLWHPAAANCSAVSACSTVQCQGCAPGNSRLDCAAGSPCLEEFQGMHRTSEQHLQRGEFEPWNLMICRSACMGQAWSMPSS